jgi:hypothetical protein
MEEWKSGRLEEVLPRRHGGHKESTKMEQFDNSIIRQWKNGRCFTTEHGGHKVSTKMEQFENSIIRQ